jgi:hypothetical protein
MAAVALSAVLFWCDLLVFLQFQPGPGNQAITVVHLFSWFHRWGDVILTTRPQVAKVLPLPSRPLPAITSTTRASPLVQAVRTGDELVVSCFFVLCWCFSGVRVLK